MITAMQLRRELEETPIEVLRKIANFLRTKDVEMLADHVRTNRFEIVASPGGSNEREG